MTIEKFQNLASFAIKGFEQVKILQVWNSLKEFKKPNEFPIGPFNDASFNVFLHKYVFWSQLTKAELVLYKPMVEKSYQTGKLPGMEFASYFEFGNGTTLLMGQSHRKRLQSPLSGPSSHMASLHALVWYTGTRRHYLTI